MNPLKEKLRKKYIDNPPEGMSLKTMDMDYFLNHDELDDNFGEEVFYIF